MTPITSKAESPPLRVLIVEEEADLRDAMIAYLQFERCLTTGAGRITDCAAWLAHPGGGVIVLDLGLPDGDGLAALGPPSTGGVTPWCCPGARAPRGPDTGVYRGGDAYLIKPMDIG